MSSSETPKSVGEIRLERSRKQAQEGAQARAELAAETREVEARTVRLRALRLEKERTDAVAAAAAEAAKPVKKPRAARKLSPA